jgi:manganese/zinc/iron transport system ATP- binding protein
MHGNDIPAVSVSQLSVNYDKTPVLWDINFDIPVGKLVGIIGPNGAGKSTLLKAMLGLLQPLSGKVEIWGKPFKEVRSKIAYVPQKTAVDWDFPITVLDVVLMGCYGRLGLLRRPKLADREAAAEALERVGMSSFAHRQIDQLSGGQKQRVFLARALLQNADLYLLDEPFAGVDVATEKAIITFLDSLRTQGKTLLVVHHDLNTVERYFDWLILLNTCLVADGPVQNVFEPEMILRTFGRTGALMEEAARLVQNKKSGLKP